MSQMGHVAISLIFFQSHRNEEGEEVYGFRADHVLLETTLNYPILRLAAGRFVS